MFIYRILFSSLCFIFFGLALGTGHFAFYLAALLCGSFSITAKKKEWADPKWAVVLFEKWEIYLREKKKKKRVNLINKHKKHNIKK